MRYGRTMLHRYLCFGEDDTTLTDRRGHWKRTPSLQKETEITPKLLVMPNCTPFCLKQV